MPHQDDNGVERKNGRLEATTEADSTEVDSTEADSCIKKPNLKPKKLPFHEQYLLELQQRTGLTRKWVLVLTSLLLTAIILFFIIIGLTIGWPTVPHMFKYPICRDVHCLRAAAQIQSNLINSTVSPCTDLWASFCSQYTGTSPRTLDRPIWNQKHALVQTEAARVRDLIATLEPPFHISTVEWKMKHLYEACLNVHLLGNDGVAPLTNIVAQLGGWYVLRDWSEVDFDGIELLTQLQVRYGVSAFFKISVEPDPHVPNTHSIRISPAGLGLPDKDYYYRDSDDKIATAYGAYIRDVVISLSATSNEASKFGKDMFNYEKRLAEITPDLATLQNPITTYNAVPLGELKQTISTIPFHDILQAMYPEVTFTESTEVIVTSPEYLTLLAQIISSTDRRTMNGYLIWCLVREYLPFFADNYISSLDTFNNELFGISKKKPRWEICSQLLRTYMGLATEYHLEQAYPISQTTKQIVQDTFNTILRVVKEKVAQFDNSALLVQRLETKLNSLTLHVGLPESIKTAQFLKDYYTHLIVYKLNLFEGMRRAVAFHRKIEEKMLQNTFSEGVLLQPLLAEVPGVAYVPSRNAIVVPRSLLMEPYFENGYPRPVQYGRLGAELAVAILSSVLPYGSLWTGDRKIQSPFHMTVNESVKSLRPNIQCLSRDLLVQVPESLVDQVGLTFLTELSAIKVAHEALLIASSMERHQHYGGLERYDESALYFLTFAQSQCADATKELEMYENLLQFQLPSRSKLELIWRQLPDFPKAFDCSPSRRPYCNVF